MEVGFVGGCGPLVSGFRGEVLRRCGLSRTLHRDVKVIRATLAPEQEGKESVSSGKGGDGKGKRGLIRRECMCVWNSAEEAGTWIEVE